jgi:hypothetical protein
MLMGKMKAPPERVWMFAVKMGWYKTNLSQKGIDFKSNQTKLEGFRLGL